MQEFQMFKINAFYITSMESNSNVRKKQAVAESVMHLSRAKNQASDTLFKVRVVILILYETLKSGSLFIKARVALDIIKLGKI